jgi:uncharacterized protein (TIGR00369 family)
VIQHPPGSGAFARTLDARLAGEPTPERAQVTMRATEAHLNANEIVHGGVAMSLLDMAMATAVTRTLAAGERAASIQIQTSFLKAAKVGDLTATGRVVRRGRSLAFAEGELTNAEGDVIARGNGIWAISVKP